MIVIDRRSTKSVPSSILTFALLCALPSAVFAGGTDGAPGVPPVPAPPPAAAVAAPAPVDAGEPGFAPPADPSDIAVRLIRNGHLVNVWTHAQSVGEFLTSHGIRVAEHDFVSASPDDRLANGMTIQYRSAKKIAIVSGSTRRTVTTTGLTVADALRDARLHVGIHDRVSPAPRTMLAANATVRIARVPSSLASIAARGISSALRFAKSALHMIATAYTGSCYGCSGITASGAHAGFGVIAVDPSIIPLGTKLFIPGYGRAIAGDTGGSIVGHRVDLGMNTLAQATRFGRRSITVYILR